MCEFTTQWTDVSEHRGHLRGQPPPPTSWAGEERMGAGSGKTRPPVASVQRPPGKGCASVPQGGVPTVGSRPVQRDRRVGPRTRIRVEPAAFNRQAPRNAGRPCAPGSLRSEENHAVFDSPRLLAIASVRLSMRSANRWRVSITTCLQSNIRQSSLRIRTPSESAWS